MTPRTKPPSHPAARADATPRTKPPSHPAARADATPRTKPPSHPAARADATPRTKPPSHPAARADATPRTKPPSHPAAPRRALRLLRCYPPSWRARYGEEFAELLIADLAEHPRSWRRTADVVRAGALARLAAAGLAGRPVNPDAAARASLAAAAGAAAAFLVSGTALWSQLAIGWQWSPPASRATAAAMVFTSVAMALLPILGMLAGGPLVAAALRQWRASRARLGGPLMLLAASSSALIVGGRHFGNSWPGTGAPWWAHQHLIPGGVAAFAWASTMSVTAYWAHPTTLAAFPAADLAWMALSPLAMLGLASAAVLLLRRVSLTPRMSRFQATLGMLALLTMAAFLAGACCWVAEGGAGPARLFHAGSIDAAEVAAMSCALLIGYQAVARARHLRPVGENCCYHRTFCPQVDDCGCRAPEGSR